MYAIRAKPSHTHSHPHVCNPHSHTLTESRRVERREGVGGCSRSDNGVEEIRTSFDGTGYLSLVQSETQPHLMGGERRHLVSVYACVSLSLTHTHTHTHSLSLSLSLSLFLSFTHTYTHTLPLIVRVSV